MTNYRTADNDALDYDQPLAGRDAEEAAAFDRALEGYEAARAASASAPGDWQAACRYVDAQVALEAFWDRRRYGAINDRIVAEIQAEQAARR